MLEALRRDCKELDQRTPAVTEDRPDGNKPQLKGKKRKANVSGKAGDGAEHHQGKHTKVAEPERTHVQAPDTPDRAVDVPIDLHPHTTILADQMYPGKRHAVALTLVNQSTTQLSFLISSCSPASQCHARCHQQC